MNINKITFKYIALVSTVFVLVFGVVSIAPTTTNACIKFLGALDPLCVIKGDVKLPSLPPLPELPGFSSSNDAPQTVNTTNTYTNSNNVNSNINSPNSNIGGSRPVAYNPAPIYNYNTYPSYNYQNYTPLYVSCYPMSLSARTGDYITWMTTAYGGNGTYYYSWIGTDSLSGYGSSISKTYYSNGYKSANVTVTSGGQTVSKNCDGSVNVYGNYSYNQPIYYPNYSYPLSVSCSADTTIASVGNSVRWNASVSGGNGSYGYSWSGTDGISGSGQSIYRTYNNVGQKYASVTVWSDGQTITRSCSNTVNVGGYYGTPVYNTPVNNNSGLDIACYSDPRTVNVNQPATWITEVTGGNAPYTYTWTGSDDLSGNTSSVIKYYGTTGNKTAIVTIKSADGRSETRACSTSITVRSGSAPANTGSVTPVKNIDNSQDGNGLSASALFSLKNVPWGWVAVLIILVLFATVMYLLFNRQKI